MLGYVWIFIIIILRDATKTTTRQNRPLQSQQRPSGLQKQQQKDPTEHRGVQTPEMLDPSGRLTVNLRLWLLRPLPIVRYSVPLLGRHQRYHCFWSHLGHRRRGWMPHPP